MHHCLANGLLAEELWPVCQPQGVYAGRMKVKGCTSDREMEIILVEKGDELGGRQVNYVLLASPV